MFVCERPEFRKSALFCAGVELCNSIDDVEWLESPVQVRLCDQCRVPGCSSGGYVHVSRLGDFVLWTAPQVDDDRHEPLPTLQTLGAIAIPAAKWSITAADVFQPANNRALADAWALGPGRPRELSRLVPMLRGKLAGGDTLDRDDAIAIVERILRSLLDHAAAPAGVRIVNASGARIETLSFDGPAEEDWPALAFIDGAPHIALSRDLVAL